MPKWQGQIQDFLIGGSNLQMEVRFVKLSDYLLIFLVIPKILHENEIIWSKRGVQVTPPTPSGSASEMGILANSEEPDEIPHNVAHFIEVCTVC